MDTRLKCTLAALAAACAASLAYGEDPIASVSRSDDTANAIAQALSADDSLKGSKITVQPIEDGAILLTGSVPKWKQMRKAVDTATRQVGEGKVVNAIRTEEVLIDLARPTPEEAQPEATTPTS